MAGTQGLPAARRMAGQPGKRIQRMTHEIAAVTRADFCTIKAHDTSDRGQIKRAPIGARLAKYCAFVPGIVGDHLHAVQIQGGVVGMAVIG